MSRLTTVWTVVTRRRLRRYTTLKQRASTQSSPIRGTSSEADKCGCLTMEEKQLVAFIRADVIRTVTFSDGNISLDTHLFLGRSSQPISWPEKKQNQNQKTTTKNIQ